MKMFIKILGIFVVLFLMAGFLFVLWTRKQIDNGDLVKWNNEWYTKDELAAMYPPQEYDAPAQNTPEEVYQIFRQALLDNDIELALEQIREENREGYREAFKDEEKFNKWVNSLPEGITKEEEYKNLASYDLDMGTENKNTVEFIKNENGYWEIDII